MIASNDFLVRYPEMKPVPLDLIEAVLVEVEQDCPLHTWKNKQGRAVMLLTAHILTLRWMQIGEIAGAASVLASGGGGASAESLGQDDLERTEYGLQFKRLRSQLTAAGTAVFTF